jgi:NAD+ kinase
MKYKNIAIIAAKNNLEAIARKDALVKQYGFKDITANHKDVADADLVVAVGGDGLMLHLLHEYEAKSLPIYGINYGTVGFLMNSTKEENFLETLTNAKESSLHPLRMTAINSAGEKSTYLAINEVALLRASSQAAKIKVTVNNHERISCLVADGIIVASAAGSTAYNRSAGGPVIPFDAEIMALTPISPFRPHSWHGAILPLKSAIKLEVLNSETRPVNTTADSNEVKDVKEVSVIEDRSVVFKILFDPNHSLEERIIREQFSN